MIAYMLGGAAAGALAGYGLGKGAGKGAAVGAASGLVLSMLAGIVATATTAPRLAVGGAVDLRHTFPDMANGGGAPVYVGGAPR